MTILVATDFSDHAESALRTASAEARRRSTNLTLLHVVDTTVERWDHLENTPSEMRNRIDKGAREKLESHYDETVDRDDQAPVETFRVAQGNAAEEIAAAEKNGDYELVVMGATGRGALSQMFLGSTAEEIVRSSETPVLVVPNDRFEDGADNVLAPIDMSECSHVSLLEAVSLARREAAHLDIFHATTLPTGALTLTEWEPTSEHDESHRKFTSRQLTSFLEGVDLEELEHEEVLRFGDAPGREIVRYADQEGSDLIVMGTHGRRGFQRFFLGSTAAKVLRSTPCPVLVVRYDDEE